MSTKNVLIGVMAGITTGTIFGVWLTSRKGVDTRKKMFLNGNQYVEILKEKFNESLNGLLSSYEKFLGNKSQAEKSSKAQERDVDNPDNPIANRNRQEDYHSTQRS